MKHKRNPILEIGNIKIQCIGDIHLGRVFRTNVPLSKVGLRELSVLKDFENLLNNTEVNCIIMMGDLFDKFIVSPTIIKQAYDLITTACTTNLDIEYILLPGNHDLSKDSTKISSFQLLSMLLKDCFYNLNIIDSSCILNLSNEVAGYFDCYNPFYEQEDSTDKYETLFDNIPSHIQHVISFGHWDDIRIGFGYLPNQYILDKSELVISGHIHTPTSFKYKNTPFIYTGSIQPYSHAEDPYKEFYITINYKTLEEYIFKNNTKKLNDLSNKNIRVECYPGYIFPYDIDCLSFSYYNVLDIPNKITEDLELIEVKDNTLTDFTSLYLYKLKYEHNIEDEIIIKLNDFLKDTSEDVQFNLD